MELKSRQWVVVWIAGFVVLGMMLYPPWVWTAKRRGLSGYVVYGLEGRTYAPIFHPPDARVPDVYKEHAKDKPYPWDLSTRLDGTRLVVQCLAVAVAAGLAIAVLSAWSAVAARLNASQKWTILTSAGLMLLIVAHPPWLVTLDRPAAGADSKNPFAPAAEVDTVLYAGKVLRIPSWAVAAPERAVYEGVVWEAKSRVDVLSLGAGVCGVAAIAALLVWLLHPRRKAP